MRLFVAVDLPDAVRQSAADSATRLREQLGRAPSRSPISWVAPQLQHLTLVFIGEVAADTAAAIEARMSPPLEAPSFAMGLGRVGMFPHNGRPRVLWLAVAEGAAGLGAAHDAVERRLEGLEYRREARAFSPHLTLARLKEGGTMDERRAVEGTRIVASPTAVVDHVTLFRSRLSPKGPEYTVLATSHLGGGPAR